MDINGFSVDPLNMEDSNPGRVVYCPGGVGRNIAENLHRLGTDVRFIGVIGDDPGGELIRNSSVRIGLNIEHSLFIKSEGSVTSVYIALMDSNGVMKLALSDMDIMEKMTKEHLDSKAGIIQESSIVVLDTNLPEHTIKYIVDKFGGKTGPSFFLDAVSARKANRAAPSLGSFDTVKLGRSEAGVLSGSKDFTKAAQILIDRGIRRVFITLGKDGVYAATADKIFFETVNYVQPQNTSGGGDAFMAGIIYGTLQGWDEKTSVLFSMAMAGITVQSRFAAAPEMSLELVQKTLKNRGDLNEK